MRLEEQAREEMYRILFDRLDEGGTGDFYRADGRRSDINRDRGNGFYDGMLEQQQELEAVFGAGADLQEGRRGRIREDDPILAEMERRTGADNGEPASGKLESIKQGLRTAYARTVSDAAPLERVARVQEKIEKGAYDAADAVQMYRTSGSTANYILKERLVDLNGNDAGESFTDVSRRAFDGVERELNEYMLHQFNSDQPGAGEKLTGYSAEESRQRVAEMEKANPTLPGRAGAVREFYDRFLQEMVVKSGMITAEQFRQLQERNPNSVPMEQAEKDSGQEGDATQETRDVRDTIADRVLRYTKMERKNELILNLYQFARRHPESAAPFMKTKAQDGELIDFSGGSLDQLDAEMVKRGQSGDYTVTAYQGGKKIRLNVSKEIYESLDNLFNGKMTRFEEMGRSATKVTRAVTSQMNPFIAVKNIMKNVPTAYVNSIAANPIVFYNQLVTAARDAFGTEHSDNYKTFCALGGKTIKFLDPDKGFVSSVEGGGKLNSAFQKAGRALSLAGEYTDTLVRYAEYLNGINRWGDTPEGRRKAIQAAADVTVNIARSGSVTRALDGWVINLNRGIQNADKMIRQYRARPVRSILRGSVPNAIAIALISLLPGGNDDNPYFKQLSNRQKETYFNIPNYFGKKDENGYPMTFIKIPKSADMSTMLINLFERAINEDFDTFDLGDFAQNTAENMSLKNPVTDSILAPLLLYSAWNRDSQGDPIVSPELEGLEERMQYDADTSAIAREIGEIFNVSPKKVDYLMDSYLGMVEDIVHPMLTQSGQPKDLNDALKQILLNPVKSYYTVESKGVNHNSPKG